MKLAELVIQLSANTASLKRDFEKATRQAQEFANAMKDTLQGALEIVGVGSLTEAIKGLVEYEHEMSDAAAATGMTVEQLSGFSFALKSVGVPLQELQLGLAQFDKITSGLMRSKAGASAVEALGLSMSHLKSVGAHEALLEVADAFKKIPDSAQKAGIASALFTSTLGQKLIPVLDEGRQGIGRLEEEARKLGFTLTEADAKAADQTYMAFQQLSAEMRGMEISAGSKLFPSLIFLGELLSRDAFAAMAFKDRLKELGLEAAKLATEVNPFTMIFGGGARDAIQKQIDQLATNESIARSDMMRGLQAITIPGTGVGAGTLHLPGLTGANGAKSHIDKVAGALRELKDQLTGLSQGSVAQGLAKLRDLGATPAQLTEGKNILNQIQSFKAAQKAAQDYSGALHEEIGTQKSLAMATSGLSSAQQEYLETVAKLNTLELKGVDITHSLALAREQYREALIAAHPAGLQGPAPDKMPLDTFFSQDSMVKFNKLNEQAKQLGQTMQSSFVGMIVEGQSFGNVLKNLTTLFAEFLLKAVVFKGLSNAFGTTGFSGLIGSFFGGLEGGRATGGPVTAGSLYMVGESGPELFSPGMSGSIIPNSSLAASRGSGNIVNIDARGADAGVEARVMRAMAAMKKQTLGQSLVMNYEYQARGGTL